MRVIEALRLVNFRLRLKKFCQSEVENFQPAVRRDVQIVWLEVAMDYALGVSRRQPFGELCAQPPRLRFVERSVSQSAAQGNALNQLHHEKVQPSFTAEIMDRSDARVIQLRQSHGLVAESLSSSLIRQEARRKHFQSNVAVELFVVRPVDHTHPAAAQNFQNTIVGNRPAGQRGRVRHSGVILGSTYFQVNAGECYLA